MSKTTIEVDTRTFIRFWLVLLGIGLIILFIYKALTALVIIGISIFLALALRPLVRRLNNFLARHFGIEKNHKTASAVLAYGIIVALVISVIAIVGPVVVNETARFAEQLPTTFNDSLGGWEGINNFGQNLGINNLQDEISHVLQNISAGLMANVGATIGTIGDILMKSVLILVLTLLFLLEGPGIMNSLWQSLGARKEDAKPVAVAKRTVSRMSNVVSTYVSRQVLVAILDGLATMFIIFILSFIFKFSTSLVIPMGLITMIFYLIPMFGQIIGGALVSIVVAFSNPIAAITFAIIYIVYAQIENNAIAPKIQGDALKLPAVAILSAIVISMYMFGLIGAIIAIPIAGCIRVLVEEYPNIKSARE